MFEEKYLIVILIVALLFGASRLPLLGRNLGQGIKEFKKGIADARRDDTEPQPSTSASGDDSPTT